ncbi:hypothetical protein [Zhaonella formicivorans]|uniref:hypothetical protein n=1 Tax=Zhaonella formicivorans TaxID=2528593 RepID=UPI0010E995D1|nr:hypothetical protein [Zhaonella formicivorans]
MKSKNQVEFPGLLAYQVAMAQKILEEHGFEIETITVTQAPQEQAGKICRVVRQTFSDESKVNLVVAYSPVDEKILRKEVE